MPTCKTPEWMLLLIQSIIDESDLGRKGLARRLDVSDAQLSYWLTGREQFPLLRFRQAVDALGVEYGRRLLNVLAPEGFFASAAVRACEVESLTVAGARSMEAEGRMVHNLCAALKDKKLTPAERDRIIRYAEDAESLLEGIKSAVRAKTGKAGVE